MAKRSRGGHMSPLARLAFVEARPVNRDTLRVIDLGPGKTKRKPKKPGPLKASGPLQEQKATKPKVRVVTASEVAAQKAKVRRMFGVTKIRVVAPSRSLRPKR